MNALLVGGPRDIRRDIEPHLILEDIRVIEHWTYDSERPRVFPKGAQLVLVLRDMTSHPAQDRVKSLAGRLGVPVVCGTRKWSTTRGVLRAAELLPGQRRHRPPPPPEPEPFNAAEEQEIEQIAARIRSAPVAVGSESMPAAPPPAMVEAAPPPAAPAIAAPRPHVPVDPEINLNTALELLRDCMRALNLHRALVAVARDGGATIQLA